MLYIATFTKACDGTHGKGYTQNLIVSYGSPDIPNNRTWVDIVYSRTSEDPSKYYNYGWDNPCSISIDGGVVASATPKSNHDDEETQVLCTWGGWIGHNSDGTRSIDVSASFTSNSSNLPSGSISGEVELPRIYRQANVTGANNFNDEQNPYMTFNNPGGFTIDVYLEVSGMETIIRNNVANTGNYTFNLTEEERNRLRSKCPNVNSMGVRYGIQTTIGSTKYWSWLDRTMTIVNANPIFNDFKFEDVNKTIVALTGNNQNVIRNYSNVKAIIPIENKAEAIKKATMSKYRFSCNSNSIDIDYSSDSEVQAIINNVKSGIFDIYAIDSRNNSKQVTKNANKVIEYNPIIKGNISTTRASGISESVTLKLNGKVDFVNFGLITNSIKESKYRYKITSTNEWSEYKNIQLEVDVDGNFAFDGLISGDTETLGFNINNSYQIEVLISDELTQAVYTSNLGSGTPNLALAKNGVGIMGKYDEKVGGKGQVAGNPLAYYPIGAIYISVNPTNPSELFGGTWEAFGTGRTLVGIDTSQTEFNTIEKTGGHKSLQQHNHYWEGTTSTAGGHNHGFDRPQWYSSDGSGDDYSIFGQAKTTTKHYWASVSWGGDHNHFVSGYTGNAGSGNSGNLQPYITCYMWKRIK